VVLSARIREQPHEQPHDVAMTVALAAAARLEEVGVLHEGLLQSLDAWRSGETVRMLRVPIDSMTLGDVLVSLGQIRRSLVDRLVAAHLTNERRSARVLWSD
jgi:hypothetical protein